jgi:hypothetical protein
LQEHGFTGSVKIPGLRGFVTGHGLIRAVKVSKTMGLSPWGMFLKEKSNSFRGSQANIQEMFLGF